MNIMNRTKKETLMRNKLSILLILIVAAAMLSACASPASTGQQPRLLNVNGHAEVQLVPDMAYISIGVHTETQSAAEAVASNNTQAQAVMTALQGAGIAAEDIRTTNFSIYPYEKFSPNNESLGIFYSVDNSVYVTLRAIDTLGSVLDTAITAGATNISGVSFDIQDKATVLTDARVQAVEDARTQADALAAAAGITLGNVYSLSYYNNYPTPVYYDSKGGGATVSAGVPISPGQMTITVDVSVAYEIK
jgi:uncharacterized protein YggE